MTLPDYEPQKLPEGTYTFTLKEEPEKRRKQGKSGEFVAVKFTFKVSGDGVSSGKQHVESMLPWEERYGQLLEALGGERGDDGRVHLSESVNIVGKSFKADIAHEPDRDDPNKSWARITKIQLDDLDDDIPF